VSRLTPEVYDHLEAMGDLLESGLRLACRTAGVAAQVQRVGSMISVFFTSQPVVDFAGAQTTNKALFGRVFHALLRRGIYLPPSALEAWFLNASHTEADIDATVLAFSEALCEVRG